MLTQVPDFEHALRASIENIKKQNFPMLINCLYEILDGAIARLPGNNKINGGTRLLVRLADCMTKFYELESKKRQAGRNVPQAAIHCSILQDYASQYLKEHQIRETRRYDVGLNIILGKDRPEIKQSKANSSGAGSLYNHLA